MTNVTRGCYVLLEQIPQNVLDVLLCRQQHLKESRVEDAPAAPDSTTSMFLEGEDVLVDRNHTGQFFMGTIVQIDRATEKCLLRFLDNKECWAHLNELQRVKDDPEEILCVICKKIDQNVCRCPKCGRGYHRSCLEPSIPEGVPPAKWLCIRCGNKTLKKKRGRPSLASAQTNVELSVSLPVSLPDTLPSKTSITSLPVPICEEQPRVPSTSNDFSNTVVKKPPIRELPYPLHSLVWDELHRVNDGQQYCYCGKPGDWYMQMLQCAYCKQWFHQDCLSCLHFPLYCGDQLYLFLCSVCNDDEFLRRFDFGWVDIVHLVIFNLILFKKKKYFDVDSEIIPYVKNNWFFLQIPAQLVKCSDSELRKFILKMLEDNSTKNCRFKSGRELNTKKRIWGLRNRVPPKRIAFSLPPVRPLTDDAVKAWWKKCHITFRPPLDVKYLMRRDVVLQPDGKMSHFNYSLMLGQSTSTCSTINSCRNLREAAPGIRLLDTSILRNKFSPVVAVNGQQVSGPCLDGFTGYAKKSSAFCASNRLALQESLRHNKRANRNKASSRSKALGKKDSNAEHCDDVLENSSQDGYESLDSQTSFSQDDTYVSSNAESFDENDASQDGYDSSGEESDVSVGVESTSLSVPMSPEDSLDSQQKFKTIPKENAKEEQKPIAKELVQNHDIPVTKTEMSLKVEKVEPQCTVPEETPLVCTTTDVPSSVASSESTPVPESVLPSVSSTPADTEFEEDSVSPPETRPSSLPTIADLIGGPLVLEKDPQDLLIPSLPRLTPVINEPPQARAVKRKLSEKDIKIVNGQVKQRRRLRRLQSNQAIGTKTVHLDSGEKLEKRIVGGKLLRSPHKPSVPETPPDVSLSQGESSSAGATFVRQEDMSVSDVKRNIKSIFNARNRISSGEKFEIKGRRVTPTGVEYLIQWDYPL